MENNVFGANLRRLRLAKGMTQEELAAKLGYTNRSSINKIEVNGRDLPRCKVALAAEILGVTPLELLTNKPLEEEDIDFVKLQKQYQKLNSSNRKKMAGYLQALLDSQEDNA